MNIESYRSSFTVFVMDGDLKRGQSTTRQIENCGYQAKLVLNKEQFQDQIKVDPPHILVLQYMDAEFTKDYSTTEDNIQWLLSVLPELHIIVLSKDEDLEECFSLYANGIHSLLAWPVHPQGELIRSVDRAAEQSYYMFLNEQLKMSTDTSSERIQINYFEIWSETLRSSQSPADWIASTLKELQRIENDFELIYLKYISAKASLVVEASEGVPFSELDSVGIDLKQTEPRFRQAQLSTPEKLLGLRSLVREGLQKKDFIALPCVAGTRIDGILLGIPKGDEMPVAYNESYFRLCLRTLGLHLALLETRNKLERYSVVDETSSALNRSFFIQKINEEIVRSRRIAKPLALLIVQLDQFYEKALEADEYEVEKFLKAVTSVFTKNSRLNDLVGRLSPDQFGFLLPHTDLKGAAIKAERLRRIIETADFTKVYPYAEKLTVSIGVAEYPSVCKDGSDLLRKADEALSEVLKGHGNKVCMATAAENFEPDFKPSE